MEKTIEAYFVERYEEMRRENEELRYILECNDNERNMDGFTDLHKKTELVRYSVSNYTNAFTIGSAWSAFGKEELAALLELDETELLEKAMRSFGRFNQIVHKSENVFPFTLELSTYKGTERFAYDPDNLFEKFVKIEPRPKINAWVYVGSGAATEALAIDELRRLIEKRIKDLDLVKEEE